MRKIKFRAWDKENKKMVFPLAIRFEIISDKYGYIFNPNFNTKEGVLTSNEYIEPKVVLKEGALIAKDITLMQYTGLLDKAGKEIYEGDIVGVGTNFKGTIVFIEGAFVWEEYDGCWQHLCKDYEDVGEVIGNIYENPELLEVEG